MPSRVILPIAWRVRGAHDTRALSAARRRARQRMTPHLRGRNTLAANVRPRRRAIASSPALLRHVEGSAKRAVVRALRGRLSGIFGGGKRDGLQS